MKKILTVLLSIICVFGIIGMSACNPQEEIDKRELSVNFVVPDGAPALSIAKLINDDASFGGKVNYRIVAAENIKSFVVGSGEKADIALVPVNMASLLLGTGSEYKGVATVTHGNLYLLSKDETAVTSENASQMLKGKTVAVVNLANVPGLTVKAMLKKTGIAFTEDEAEKNAENVLLTGIAGTDIAVKLNTGAADYVVAPEPAVSTITGKVPAIKKVAGLHDIYGKYPQAIMVVKSGFLEKHKDFIIKVFDAMTENAEWIVKNPAAAADAVKSKLQEGATPSFSAENTTESSVKGCNIKPEPMNSSNIDEINAYIEAIMQFNGSSPVAKAFSENFFVNIKD